MRHLNTFFYLLTTTLLSIGCSLPSQATSTFQEPSTTLKTLIDRRLTPGLQISGDQKWMAILERQAIPSISEFVDEEWKLAGLRIDPKRQGPSRLRASFKSIEVTDLETQKKQKVKVPDGIILSPKFSPDGNHLAFLLKTPQGFYLYHYSTRTQKLQRFTDQAINTTIGNFEWRNDSQGVITRIVINDKPLNLKNTVPSGPNIQVSGKDGAPVRTYQDLLKNPTDEKKLDWAVTAQLANISLQGKIIPIGKPTIHRNYKVSPDNRYIVLQEIKRPYSYLVPYQRFPTEISVYDLNGKKVKTIADLPLADNIPQGFDSVRTGIRNALWRSDKASTLLLVSALDDGDMKKDVEYHDQLWLLDAPFDKEPMPFTKTTMRFAGMSWGNSNTAFLTEWRFSDRQIKESLLSPQSPDARQVISQRSYNDAYNDIGNPAMTLSQFNTPVLKVIKENLFFTGNGASSKGNIPFLRRYSIREKQFKTLWESEAPYYERVAAILDNTGEKLITLRESTDQPVNIFLHDSKQKTTTPLTQFTHPTPAYKNISKELIRYKRQDGVDLTGTLYLPENYIKGTRLPVIMWAYPLEYKDQSVAGQVRNSPYQFKNVSYWGPLPFLANGFAVFDDPKMPIVGEKSQQPNDTFRLQLVMSAEAAIKVLVDKGVADPKRIAIGGHSYGAFMVANLLAHSDLFAAGIARSGAYNRSLTPFGFQGEERTFWQAQHIYANMSPFFHAEKINEPILMIHGEEDNNSGTYPMQSKRMFNALKGLGKEARLVMLPKESHGYRHRESLLHMLWEQEQWLNTKVKNK